MKKPLPVSSGMDDAAIRGWLRETDPSEIDRLFAAADAVRREQVGEAVHLRGLIEISNACVRSCAYCGISVHNRDIVRYRMGREEILDCARRAKGMDYGTTVLQAGEDPLLTKDFICEVIRAIKAETGLAVTLSLGERSQAEYAAWREAGADRYLLRFETSDPALFAHIHPPARGSEPTDRIAILRQLAALGYQAGSGVMVGIPGQTWDTLVRDLRTFQQLDLDMIGIGPWIPHPLTPLAKDIEGAADPTEQVPNSVDMTLKMVALTRILVPDANIPATTAVATLDQQSGRENALKAGANIVMPNLTPPKYRELYEIYPNKACVNETAEQCHSCLAARIASVGRCIGMGPGEAPKLRRRPA